ncbi:MAG: undecaprenyldiphospho-muramoylpentapeptide beta-N-acetylglucosaminyltransferase [Clostridia bacterium]|nr:undecaprenyldiphospho-muramoylpentapeptide beta-N-acetylglucosaminyltransferase [Clostridia bacterium]
MLNGKKIIFAAGGTGGHINPALAVAGEVRRQYPDAKILFIGTAEKMEARLVPAAGYDFKTIQISGFNRVLNLNGIKQNIKTLSHLLKSSSQAKKIIREFAPDVVIGFGGYVSGPVVRAAAKLGIPTAIHEQNAFPGVTNKTLAKMVDAVMLTAEQAAQYMQPKNPVIVTGLPVRGELLEADRDISRAELGLDEKPLILSMGGSLGAKAINEAMLEVISNRWQANNCTFMHATGKDCKDFPERLAEKGADLNTKNIIVRDYINDMHRCLAAADLVICRAGASSLSEFQALGKPSILIPYPFATENHQFHNAKALADKGAAIVIEEKDLTSAKLMQQIDTLLESPGKLDSMGRAAKSMAVTDAQARIVEVLGKIAK